jgi:hypothetical protein
MVRWVVNEPLTGCEKCIQNVWQTCRKGATWDTDVDGNEIFKLFFEKWGADWIKVAQHCIQWCSVLNTVKDICVLQKQGILRPSEQVSAFQGSADMAARLFCWLYCWRPHSHDRDPLFIPYRTTKEFSAHPRFPAPLCSLGVSRGFTHFPSDMLRSGKISLYSFLPYPFLFIIRSNSPIRRHVTYRDDSVSLRKRISLKQVLEVTKSPTSLHYLKIFYHLCCLTTVNYS